MTAEALYRLLSTAGYFHTRDAVVLVLQPNGDRIPCEAMWDADGHMTITPHAADCGCRDCT